MNSAQENFIQKCLLNTFGSSIPRPRNDFCVRRQTAQDIKIVQIPITTLSTRPITLIVSLTDRERRRMAVIILRTPVFFARLAIKYQQSGCKLGKPTEDYLRTWVGAIATDNTANMLPGLSALIYILCRAASGELHCQTWRHRCNPAASTN